MNCYNTKLKPPGWFGEVKPYYNTQFGDRVEEVHHYSN